MHRPLIVLLGPTAVGKSRIAVQVARHFATDVLTADSRQVYRGMDIGTDKPSVEEREEVPHRLIDLLNPNEIFNTGWYRRAALVEIERLYAADRLPLVVGGTGLYIRALVRGLCPAPVADPELRAELLTIARERGRDLLYAELARVDPATAKSIHPNDEAKTIRALEVYRLTGRPISALHGEHRFQDVPFSSFLIGLRRPSKDLYRRIEERIDRQLARGMIEETRSLLNTGYGRQLAAMKGLGYRQVAAYLAGECAYADMVTQFKRDTRRFAKRQMTWFRKEPGVVWVSIGDDEPLEHTAKEIITIIHRFLENREGAAQPGLLKQATAGEGAI